ncbi:hypothetical protein [Kineosporia succinea]|uniref:Uncharacterized protein n=1 Tax=Kineosporia succinea TaxID=84632 RepID=A0ABT9NX72_9ACTN|nr:hypothetical protein [Kineosporia succinea]MDP9825019.1 hypothetical protein [Kineosporia succinea]
MSSEQPSDDALGAPDPSRGGSTIDEAVANAEAGSRAEGDHTPSGQAASGESRAEKMTEVDVVSEPRASDEPPDPGPSPVDVGSGGAQRVVGARVSDRVAAGETPPDGPPFGERSSGSDD